MACLHTGYIFFRSGGPPMTMLTAGAFIDPQLPATASTMCATDAWLGGVGRVAPSKQKSWLCRWWLGTYMGGGGQTHFFEINCPWAQHVDSEMHDGISNAHRKYTRKEYYCHIRHYNNNRTSSSTIFIKTKI